jgi:alkylation response protein AidB-like acyl-CoA dehydrogenase
MIPRTLFSPEHELFRDSVRTFLEKEAVPFHAQWEKQGYIDRKLWNKAGEAGMLCSHLPEEYGGLGADFLYSAVVIEEVGRLGLTGIGFSLHSDIVAPYILHYGSEALKHKYLPKLVSGEMVTAIAMTEPGAGSDLQGVKTTAVLDGDEYVINGSKTFITNGFLADLVIVVAKTDPKAGAKGTSLFLVEANTPGFDKGKRLEKGRHEGARHLGAVLPGCACAQGKPSGTGRGRLRLPDAGIAAGTPDSGDRWPRLSRSSVAVDARLHPRSQGVWQGHCRFPEHALQAGRDGD